MIFAFLERVQFSFKPQDAEMNKEIVHEVLRDLHLKKSESDPNYAKFCCYFILKVPGYAIPEGFCLKELFQYIFATLGYHWTIFSDLLKHLSSVLYSLCFKATSTHRIHVIDIIEQLGDLAYTHLNDAESILLKIRQEAKTSADLNKSIGEFMELHHLISWMLHFPLKERGKQNDPEAVLIQRMYCKNCGYKRQKNEELWV